MPFLHFFDGFRTSHEVNTLDLLGDAQIRAMIDDDLVRAHRARALDPGASVRARHGAQPRHLLPGARGGEPVSTRACRRSCSRDGPLRRADRPAIPSVRLRRPAGCRARRGADGLRRRDRARDRGSTRREAARRSASCRCGCTGRSPAKPSSPRCRKPAARIAVLEQTKEPGAPGEPLYLDVVAALAQAVAAGRRATMPRVIGGRYGLSSKDFNPAMAKAVFDELQEAQSRRTASRSASTTMSRTPASTFDPHVRDRAGRRGARGVLRPGRRRHGRRQQEQRQDHRRGCRAATRRATSSTTRTSPARRRSRICASGRGRSSAPYLIQQASFVGLPPVPVSSTRLDVLRLAAPRRHLPAEQPVRAGRGVGPPAALDAAADHRQEAALLRHRRVQGGAARSGSRGRTNTVLQTCFFAISGVLPRDEAIARIKEAIRKTYGEQGRGGGAAEFRRPSTARSRVCSR